MKINFKVSLFVRERAGGNMTGGVQNSFLIQRKETMLKKHVRKLKTTCSGQIITDPFNILIEQKRFYQELYTSQSKKADNTRATEFFLNNLNIPGLTEQQRLSCDCKITSDECLMDQK